MSAFSVEVASLVTGDARSGPRLESIRLELVSERITARDLIRRTVAAQIRDLTERRRLDAGNARRALDRQYLSEAEIRQQAAQGRVRFPSERTAEDGRIDVEHEIERALWALQTGRYQVVVDGVPVAALGDEIVLTSASKVVFLRLMPLVGG